MSVGGPGKISDDLSIVDHTIIITGAGAGIGREAAFRLAESGAFIVVADREGLKANETAQTISAQGGQAIAIEVDVSDEAQVKVMAEATLAWKGRIDGLINNAALFTSLTRARFEDLPLSEWDAVFNVNVKGALLCARAVAPTMRQQRYGRIINISSNTVAMGRPNFLHYVSSKAAIIGMSRSLARELGPDNVTVNAIMPSLTRTEHETPSVPESAYQMMIDLQCLKRTATPLDTVRLLAFLLSPASGFVTGQTLAVDGGAIHL